MAHVQVTWATLRARLDERIDSSQHWVDAEKLIAMNDTLKLLNLLTGLWRRRVTVTFTPAGDPYLPLTSTMTWPMRMELADGTFVEKTSIPVADLAIPGWEGQTTADGGDVPTIVTSWMPRGLQFLTVWPRPIVNTGLVFDGISETPVLAADGDFIDIDQGQLDVLLGCAAHFLTFKDGGPLFEATVVDFEALVLMAGDLNEEIRSSAIYLNAQQRDSDRDHRPRVRGITQTLQQFASQQFRKDRTQ